MLQWLKYLLVSIVLILTNDAFQKDPIEIAGLFEGDIEGLTSRDIAVFHGEARKTKEFFRNAIIHKRKIRPDKRIPFVLKDF